MYCEGLSPFCPQFIFHDHCCKDLLWVLIVVRKLRITGRIEGEQWIIIITICFIQARWNKWKFHYFTNLYFSLFEDVLPAFKYWTSNNIKIFIYSSGSIDAQRLLFGNSKFGDLLKVIIIVSRCKWKLHWNNFVVK